MVLGTGVDVLSCYGSLNTHDLYHYPSIVQSKSNLIYCFAGAISSPKRETQCAKLTKIVIIRRVEGRQGQKSEIAGVTKREGNLVAKLELKRWVWRCYRGAISYLEGERVPKNRGIVTERIGEKFD